MRCEDVMKRTVACARRGETVAAAARRMRDENIGFLPVCDDDGVVVGVLTDRDIAMRVDAEGRSPTTCTVADAMTAGVVSCLPHEDLWDAEGLMATHGKSRIVVTDDAGHLCGVISLSDVANFEGARRAAATLRKISAREARL